LQAAVVVGALPAAVVEVADTDHLFRDRVLVVEHLLKVLFQ
jgi:hypothetical protein